MKFFILFQRHKVIKMKIIYIVYFFIFVVEPLVAQWQEIETNIKEDLVEVCFTDSLNGWAISENKIIHTSDGGFNWHEQIIESDSIILSTVFFIDSTRGFCAGYIGKSDLTHQDSIKGIILRTTNKGNTWKLINTQVSYPVSRLSFPDKKFGWARAGLGFLGGAILNTTDSGKTWQVQKTNSSDFLPPNDVHFVDSSIGFVIGSNSSDNFGPTYFYKTSNGGITWNYINKISPLVFQLTVLSDRYIWVNGFGMAVSNDGGSTWQEEEMLNGTVNDILIKEDKIIWQLKNLFNEQTSRLYSSEDRGNSWYEIEIPYEGVFRSIANIGKSKKVCLVGNKGKIIIYNDRITAIKQQEIDKPSFILYQNYPNPFNPTTKIAFTLPAKDNVKLAVYDILGREIVRLADGIFEAGKHEFNFNASNLPSGFYFYNIQTSKGSISKKMILLK